MARELHRMLKAQRQAVLEADVPARVAVVRTTATSPDDEVEVTLPNSDHPNLREAVNWRPGVKIEGSSVLPRYPEEDDEGIVIEDDTGELWLIW